MEKDGLDLRYSWMMLPLTTIVLKLTKWSQLCIKQCILHWIKATKNSQNNFSLSKHCLKPPMNLQEVGTANQRLATSIWWQKKKWKSWWLSKYWNLCNRNLCNSRVKRTVLLKSWSSSIRTSNEFTHKMSRMSPKMSLRYSTSLLWILTYRFSYRNKKSELPGATMRWSQENKF